MTNPDTRSVWEIVEDFYGNASPDTTRGESITDTFTVEFDWNDTEDTTNWKNYTIQIKPAIKGWVNKYNSVRNLRTATLLRVDNIGFAIKFEWRGEIMPHIPSHIFNTPFASNDECEEEERCLCGEWESECDNGCYDSE
jgi:hypothetical protein